MPRPAPRYLRRNHPTSPKRIPAPQLSSSPRSQLDRELAKKPLVQPLQDSDDSDRLVVKGAGGRRGRFLRKREAYASGGVGDGDKPGSHPTGAQRRKQMIQARESRPHAEAGQRGDSARREAHHSPGPVNQRTDVAPSAPSSSVRPVTAQPTPTRENSILDGIRPRRRQHSILRPPDMDDSSLGLTEDSFALPDDESTPLNKSQAKAASSTPTTSQIPSLTSRKRKLGSSEPVRSTIHPTPAAKPAPSNPSPEPTLPPVSLSSLRDSGRKQRQKLLDEDDDIMAPPMSSSSSTSPAKSKTLALVRSRKPHQQPASLSTEQLQALMPTKRRKPARDRKRAHSEFDIPEDSESHSISPAQDSSFIPATRRKAKKPRPPEKYKEQQDLRASTTKSKQKSRPVRTTRTKKSSSNPSTRLTLSSLSRSARNQGTKSSSQQSGNPRTRSPSSDPNTGKPESSGRGKQSGGSPLKAALVAIEGKENMQKDEDEGVLVVRSDDEQRTGVQKQASRQKKRSFWDEIDGWAMDFEEVEVWERSSEKDAR